MKSVQHQEITITNMYLCFHFSLPKNLLCKYLSRRFRKKRLVSPVLDVEQQILYLDKIFYHEIFSLYPFITSDKSCVIIYTYKSDVTFARHRSFGYSSEQQTHNYFCAIIREIMNSSETQAIASDNDNTKTRYIKIHLLQMQLYLFFPFVDFVYSGRFGFADYSRGYFMHRE